MSSENVNVPNDFNYHMAIALIIAWSLVYICMVQGITSSGKVVYVTAIFPYVVLIIFFFRGITLKGLYDSTYSHTIMNLLYFIDLLIKFHRS